MRRMALGLGGAVVLLAAAGCTMCCHPNDYCGPVYEGGRCQSCSLHSRAGSILAGTTEIEPSPDLAQRPAQNQTVSNASLRRQVHGDTKPGDVPGSEQILSVTDRVVGSSTDSDGGSQLASDPSSESSKPLSSQGWTARRPTFDITR